MANVPECNISQYRSAKGHHSERNMLGMALAVFGNHMVI